MAHVGRVIKMRRASSILVALALLTSSAATWAGEPTSLTEAELATARALFEEGLAREDAKDWAGALARFRRVAEIRVTPQVTYNIALCLENTGKPALADKEYERVEKEGPPELARLAAARRKEVAKSIAFAMFEGGASDVAVTLDGAALTPPVKPLPIDPGHHELVAKGRGGSAKKTFVAKAGQTSRVVIPIPSATPTEAPPSGAGAEKGSIPVAAWITGGVAVVSIPITIVAIVSRSSAIDELDAACGPNRDACPESKRSTADRVDTMTGVANISGAVGIAAALATAGILVFAWKPDAKSSAVSATASGVQIRF